MSPTAFDCTAASTLAHKYHNAALVSTTARVRTMPDTNVFCSKLWKAARAKSTILQIRASRYHNTFDGSFDDDTAIASTRLGRVASSTSSLSRISFISEAMDSGGVFI